MSPFDPPPLLTRLLSSPILFLLRPLHTLLLNLRPAPRTRTPSQRPIRVVCISDTHDHHLLGVPDGDLLIHAGDLTNSGARADIQAAVDWLKTLPHTEKVVVAGNHDGWLDEEVRGIIVACNAEDGDGQGIDWGSIHYLQNSSVTLTFPFPTPTSTAHDTAGKSTTISPSSRTLTIHGAPQIPQLDPSPDSIHAFQYPPTTTTTTTTPGDGHGTTYPYPIPIPPDTDILVTHTPPAHHLDNFPYSAGCPHLLRAAWRIRPLLHVFGHVHVGRGVERAYYDRAQDAWEALCRARAENGALWERGSGIWSFVAGGGWWRDLCGVDGVWGMAGRVVWEGVKAVVVGRLWDSMGLGREGWMVNAACLDGSGKVLRGATVVEI
ncbi:phosphoric ester hydrolase [Blastomyces dermatitidis ATCC 18188]|uniref:Phosphoric ester hydrolase n=1 Tax=Ajellomyces dermatitidis (strain ATCC 18188 / CBS 674.68) TaxID=653446 RepID=F2TNC6_AJEDA|nr:phosphoric ester hydrolase [Blastomyces dermatitidis ATCC 18188]EQL30532.1 hypothetical protein BDFG_06932 [Blastomyces dermatitidis ATCC 26199]